MSLPTWRRSHQYETSTQSVGRYWVFLVHMATLNCFAKLRRRAGLQKTSVAAAAAAAAAAARRAMIVGGGFRCGGGAQVYFDSSPVYLMKYRKAPISCRTLDQATLLGPLTRPQAAIIFTHHCPFSPEANTYYPTEGRRLSRWDVL